MDKDRLWDRESSNPAAGCWNLFSQGGCYDPWRRIIQPIAAGLAKGDAQRSLTNSLIAKEKSQGMGLTRRRDHSRGRLSASRRKGLPRDCYGSYGCRQ